jgi:hypothetical protein
MVSRLVTFKLWGAWRGVLDYIEIIWQKQEKNGHNWSSTSSQYFAIIRTPIGYIFLLNNSDWHLRSAYVTSPRGLYKEVWFLMGFYLISFELAKIQIQSNLFIVVTRGRLTKCLYVLFKSYQIEIISFTINVNKSNITTGTK